MKAIILAGGKGTRLRPYTVTIPKPLLPIGDMSALELLIRQLARDGVHDIRMTVAYKANLIQAMFGSGDHLGVHIEYFCEDAPLGTAGCLAQQGDWLDRDVVVCNGDLLTNVDFGQILREHAESDAEISLCVREQQVAVPYGVVEFDADQILAAYREKPTLSYWVSMGIVAVSPSIIELIRPGERIDMPDLHVRAMTAARRVRCVPHRGPWFDIGAFEDYNRACEAFAQSPQLFLGPAHDE